ncbi:MAG: FIVAR domain-containing protein, partial [Clostridiales bacterium]|nr:FIVAR domain-containing protein [Clostridiales bacterium]
MGGPVVDGEASLVVAEDGTMTVSYQLKGMLAVGSYYGLGQLYLLTSAADIDGDGDVDVYDFWKNQSTGTDGDLIKTNFTPITVVNWGNVDSKTGENILYEGKVTASEDGKVFYGEDGNRVAPRDVTLTLPSYIKNDGYNNEIYVATYEANAMNRWTVMKYQLDFDTLQKVEEELEPGDYEVAVSVLSAKAPGDTTALPMGSDTVVSPAVLHVSEDGTRTMTVNLTHTTVGGIYGHLGSFRVFYGESANAVYNGIQADTLEPTDVTVDSWYTATTKSGDKTVYSGTPTRMEKNGGVYYTVDGQVPDFSGGATNMAYPGAVTFTLPSYTDGTDGGEIYVSTFIDAMGSGETVIKLVLGTGGTTPPEENPLEDLITAVNNAKKLNESDYTASTWSAMQEKLSAAQELISSSSTDETAIAAALTELNAAVDALKKRGSGGDSGSGGSETVDPTKTGSYKVPVYVYSSKGGGTNMGDGIFDNNRKGLVVVKNGTATLEFATNPINKSGVISAVTEMQYSTDGGKTYQSVEVLDTTVLDISETSYKPDDGSTVPDTITYISRARLELEEPGAEYVYMKFKVPYTPMDAIGAGDASGEGMSSLIYLDWDEAEKTSDSSLK